MIPSNSTVLRKLYNKSLTRVGIEAIRVGHYIRTIDLETGDYRMSKVISIVKLTLPKYEITTSNFDTIACSSNCKFMCLDGMVVPWSPTMSIDHTTRLVKRDASKVLTPFVKSAKLVGSPLVFYDLIVESEEPQAVLVDGYAKIFTTRIVIKNGKEKEETATDSLPMEQSSNEAPN